jgi:hypothetical protein
VEKEKRTKRKGKEGVREEEKLEKRSGYLRHSSSMTLH